MSKLDVNILFNKSSTRVIMNNAELTSMDVNGVRLDLTNITRLSVTEEYIMHMSENNNINFYDNNGSYVCNIKDIVGETKETFTGGRFQTIETLKVFNSNNIDLTMLNSNHTFCSCNTWNDQVYVIDLTERKLIAKFCWR